MTVDNVLVYLGLLYAGVAFMVSLNVPRGIAAIREWLAGTMVVHTEGVAR